MASGPARAAESGPLPDPGVFVPSGQVAETVEGGGAPAVVRRLTATTVGMFIPVAFVWAVSLPVVMFAGLIFGSSFNALAACLLLTVVGWTLGSLLMLIPAVEKTVAGVLFKVREPTHIEAARLEPIWQRVCKHAGVDPDEFILRIEDSDSVNAAAAGGHLVSVTRVALRLPDRQLAAIIAHELGHHRDMHPVALILSWWYVLPMIPIDWMLRFNILLSSIFSRTFAGFLMVYMLRIFRWLLFVPVKLANLAAATLSRSAEYAADRHAADMGYAAGLLELFQTFIDQGADQAAGPVGHLMQDHPPFHKRMRALTAHLAATAPARAA